MDAPPVQYVKTSDGYSIAYAVQGEGMPLVVAPAGFSHVQLNWKNRFFVPTRPSMFEVLADRFRLVTSIAAVRECLSAVLRPAKSP
jgi:hypothetical protein